MRLNKRQLKRIIREVKHEILRESRLMSMTDDEIRDSANRGGQKDGGRRMMKQRDRLIALGGMSDKEAAEAAMDRSPEAVRDFENALDTYRHDGRLHATKMAYRSVANKVAAGKY